MNMCKAIEDRVTERVEAARKEGYEAGLKAAMDAVDGVAPKAKEKPKARSKAKAKTKTSVAKGVILDLAKTGGKLRRATILGACQEKGIDPAAVNNALTGLKRTGKIDLVETGVYAAPAANGAAAEA